MAGISLPHFNQTQGNWVEKIEENDVVEGFRLHVFNYNHDERILMFSNVDITAEQVCSEMAQQERLKPESEELFSLWIIGNNLELQFKPKQDVFEMIEKFPRFVQKYTHEQQATVRWRLVYKREAMVSIAKDRKVKDPNAIRLLYYEAALNVLYSRYPLPSEKDAIVLAGLRAHLLLGDYNAITHKPGYLAAEGVMEKLMPSHYFPRSAALKLPLPLRPGKLGEWEDGISAEHAKHRGKPAMIAQLLYLQYCRQWPIYGSTFFIACSTVPPRGYFEYRNENLLVGINAEGIHIMDADKAKLVSSFFYDDINWDANHDALRVIYGSADNPAEVVLITPQAKMAASLITRAIKNLDLSDANREELRRVQSQMRTDSPVHHLHQQPAPASA